MKLIIDTEKLSGEQDEALAKVLEHYNIEVTPIKKMGKEIKIGEVGVDSGQLMVCDPCYIDSEWKREHVKFNETVIFPDGTKEKIVRCSKRWFELIDDINTGKIKVETVIKPKNNFSYCAVCEKTLNIDGHGQLNYEIGHPGVAVAFNSGLGDGCYPVYAKIVELPEWGKRIAEVRIDMLIHPFIQSKVKTKKEEENVQSRTDKRK
jgi:hypothetical protein